jgi:hypothetical protein
MITGIKPITARPVRSGCVRSASRGRQPKITNGCASHRVGTRTPLQVTSQHLDHDGAGPSLRRAMSARHKPLVQPAAITAWVISALNQ